MFPSPRNTAQPAPRPWREWAGRAFGLAVAFLTLDEVSGAPVPAEPPHPHRRPLRSLSRPRRPGAGPPRVQLCGAPVAAPGPAGRLRPAGGAERFKPARRP